MHRYGDLAANLAAGRHSKTLEDAPNRFTGVLKPNYSTNAYTDQHRRRRETEGGTRSRANRKEGRAPSSMSNLRQQNRRRLQYVEERRQQSEKEEERRRATILTKRRLRNLESSKALRTKGVNSPAGQRRPHSGVSQRLEMMSDAVGEAISHVSHVKKVKADPVKEPPRRALFRRLAVEREARPVLSVADSSSRRSKATPSEGFAMSVISDASSLLHGPSFAALNECLEEVQPHAVDRSQLIFDDEGIRKSVNAFSSKCSNPSRQGVLQPPLGRNSPKPNQVPSASRLATVNANGSVRDSQFFKPADAKYLADVPRPGRRPQPHHLLQQHIRDHDRSLPALSHSAKSDMMAIQSEGPKSKLQRRRRALPCVRMPREWQSPAGVAASVFSEPIRHGSDKKLQVIERHERELQQRLTRLNQTLKTLRSNGPSIRSLARQEMAENSDGNQPHGMPKGQAPVPTPIPLNGWNEAQVKREDSSAPFVVCEGGADEMLPRIRISSHTQDTVQKVAKSSQARPIRPSLVPKRSTGKAEFAVRRRRGGR